MIRPDLPAHITVRALTGGDLADALDAVAHLRISVFRDWPYLYDGSLEYERDYLQTYRDTPQALLVGAFDGTTLVGASTSTPMEDHAEAFGAPFAAMGLALSDILYGAESVLLPPFRGIGIGHRFIDLREDHARGLGRKYVAFCSVRRAPDDPRRPTSARTNDVFWQGHGYAPLPDALARFDWKDLGEDAESTKELQFWMRKLGDSS